MIEKFGIATKVVLISQDRKALVLRRSPADSFAKGEYDLPGGRLELSETPLEGITRELFEETALVVRDFFPIKTWSFLRETEHVIGITYVSFTERIHAEIPVRLSAEHSEFLWVGSDEIATRGFLEWLQSELTLAFAFRK